MSGLIFTSAAASARSAAAASELESGREGFEFDISNQGGGSGKAGEAGGAGGAGEAGEKIQSKIKNCLTPHI